VRTVYKIRAYPNPGQEGRDFLHKTSNDLVRRFDVIAVEDLNVAGMVRNRSLAKSISETGWGPAGGTRHDRDLNAAKNIRAAGLAAGP
jgi:transposase